MPTCASVQHAIAGLKVDGPPSANQSHSAALVAQRQTTHHIKEITPGTALRHEAVVRK